MSIIHPEDSEHYKEYPEPIQAVFAHCTCDSTGIDFCIDFVGDDYSGILSNLEYRHAVTFGKASSCNTPVMMCLNERDDFFNHFRNKSETIISEPKESRNVIDQATNQVLYIN